MRLHINGSDVELDVDPDMPLLWALRDHAGLRGTKYGCGIGLCGACTVHVDGLAVRSCSMPVGLIEDGAKVITIEGLGTKDALHPVQAAWVTEQAPQCGYCQPGQIMQAAALLAENPDPSDEEIVAAMNGNLCRCGAYDAIRAAIKRAAGRPVETASAQPGVDPMTTQSIGDDTVVGFSPLPERGPSPRVPPARSR